VTIRTILVDDEKLARRGLRARLESVSDVTVIGEYSSGTAALVGIRQAEPDLVFLDIQMPGMSGLEVAAALGPNPRPHVIFVTGYEDYAIRAFELSVLDYLLKPIEEGRLDAALDRARRALKVTRDSDIGQRVASAISGLSAVPSPAAETRLPYRLLVRTGDRTVVVPIEDVDWIGASRDYVTIHVGAKQWLLREPLSALATRCAAHGIVRIHRSTLVQLNRVVELRPLVNGEFTVLLRDGTELKMSRNFRSALDALISDRA